MSRICGVCVITRHILRWFGPFLIGSIAPQHLCLRNGYRSGYFGWIGAYGSEHLLVFECCWIANRESHCHRNQRYSAGCKWYVLSLFFVLSFHVRHYFIYFLILFSCEHIINLYLGDVMAIATNLTVAASSSLSLIGQTTVQAALNIFKQYLPFPFFLFLRLSSLCPQSFFYSIASVQGSISFGQSTASSAAVGATVTGSAAVSNGGSLVFYGTNYLTSSVVLYASSILVCILLLYYIILYYIILYYIIFYYILLYFSIFYYIILYYILFFYNLCITRLLGEPLF